MREEEEIGEREREGDPSERVEWPPWLSMPTWVLSFGSPVAVGAVGAGEGKI